MISGFQTLELFLTEIHLIWTTDVPSTSQVEYQDPSGVVKLTTQDTTLTTSHSVVIFGLPSGTTFILKAISVSANQGKTISAPITGNTF